MAVSRILPLPNRVGDIGGPSTWGAGTAALDIRFAQQMLINGLTTVGELRDDLGLPALDLADLLR
jgi:hypothetical protein